MCKARLLLMGKCVGKNCLELEVKKSSHFVDIYDSFFETKASLKTTTTFRDVCPVVVVVVVSNHS